MKRQIKFRAWDAEQNKMIETFDGEYQIHVNEEDGTLYCGGHMPNGDWNELPLMQFTGLLDKKGNEIFEGDIVKTEYYNHSSPNVFIEQEVIFEKGTFALKSSIALGLELEDTRQYVPLYWCLPPNKIEIVGNIHKCKVS